MKHEEAPPEGFVLSEGRGPFTTHNGPVYHKAENGIFRQASRINPSLQWHGIAHGGWLSAFTDGVLGAAVWRETKAPSVTLRLSVDFLDMVRPGEWVEGTAQVTRATRTLAFARAELSAGGRKVLTAEGVFKLMRARPSQPKK
jgi:acyl-coenzyme A thioesterase PaaI-like protein